MAKFKLALLALMLMALMIAAPWVATAGSHLEMRGLRADTLERLEEPEPLGEDIPQRSPSTRRDYHHSVYDYDLHNVYYLGCQNMTGDTHYLTEEPVISHADSTSPGYPGLNKEDLNETYTDLNPMNFSFPRAGKTFYAPFDGATEPGCNITVNSLGNLLDGTGGPGKILHVSALFDTNGDYDIAKQAGTIEGRLDFDFDPTTPGVVDPYTTEAPGWPSRQQEEFMDGVGVWNGPQPGAMVGGRIYIMVWRTDLIVDDDSNITADFILYCGFTNKTSWFVLPYKHQMQAPHADAGPDQGFDELGMMIVRERETVHFDGSGSWDPQDDTGMDGLTMWDAGWTGPDNGEDSHNIEDGYPEGEPNYEETSNLKYRWHWGVGAQMTPWMDTPFASHEWILPAGVNETIFKVTLTVRDPDMNSHQDFCLVKVLRDPGTPPTPTITVYPDNDDTDNEATILVNQWVQFVGYATDPDANQLLTYYWDLDNRDPNHIPSLHSEFETRGNMNPTYKYSIPGEYLVTLNVYDGPVDDVTGEKDMDTQNGTDSILLHVKEFNTEPTVAIGARLSMLQPLEPVTEITAKRGQEIYFDSSLCEDPDMLPGFDVDDDYIPDHYLKYKWDFGDGTMSSWTTGTEATHNYSAKGSTNNFGNYYSVYLYVSDGPEGKEDENYVLSDEFKVYVDMPPVAMAGPDRPTVTEGELETGTTITFDGTGSYDPNDDLNGNGRIDEGIGEVDLLSYEWDLGDDTTSTDPVVEHVYDEPGTYTVTLRVDDGSWSVTDSLTVDIVAKNIAPDVSPALVIPTTVYTYDDITFDARDCFDPDGGAYTDGDNATPYSVDLSFEWSFGDGFDEVADTTATASKTTFNYTEDGEYVVTLTVTDNKGLATTTAFTVTVLNRAPIAKIRESSAEIRVGDAVIFSAEGSEDTDGDIVSYHWTYGEEEYKSGTMDTPRANHTYKTARTYNVTLIVTDDDGAQSSSFYIVTVLPPDNGGDRDPGFFGLPGFTGIMVFVAAAVAVGVAAVVIGRRKF